MSSGVTSGISTIAQGALAFTQAFWGLDPHTFFELGTSAARVVFLRDVGFSNLQMMQRMLFL
jgi:hypothetical protein